MGLFDDMKQALHTAAAISADDVVVVPSPRIDTVVTDPGTGEPRHRTDYAGTVWFGGRPQLSGAFVISGAHEQFTMPFWLPDSLGYEPSAAALATVQASVALQGLGSGSSGGQFHVLDVSAGLGQDPGGGALLAYVSVSASTGLPVGLSYRATVLCPREVVRSAAA